MPPPRRSARRSSLPGRRSRRWDATPAGERAACLERAADALEARRGEFLSLLVREAGKTLPDAVAELREAVDFCRYYAARARELFAAPTELRRAHRGAQHAVAARPRRVRVHQPVELPARDLHGPGHRGPGRRQLGGGQARAGDPAGGARGGAAAARGGHPRCRCCSSPRPTGRRSQPWRSCIRRWPGWPSPARPRPRPPSTARWRARDGAILPLIAETGGVNAMVVDATALPEQVVDDVITSAFTSAGQRCSALRVLYLQEEVAERTLAMLTGAMRCMVIGDPAAGGHRRRPGDLRTPRSSACAPTPSACAARPSCCTPARCRPGSSTGTSSRHTCSS